MDSYETGLLYSTEEYEKSDEEELWEKKAVPLLRGMEDLKHMFRRSGEPELNPLDNKRYFVFVCCYLSPNFDFFDDAPSFPKAFHSVCLDLYSYRHDFELVLVTKGDESAFSYVKDSVSIPLSSLVVPFDLPLQRTFMCDLFLDSEVKKDLSEVGFAYKFVFVDIPEKAVVLGGKGKHSSIVDHLNKLLNKIQSDDSIDYQRGVLRTMWPLDSNWLSVTPPLHPPVCRIFENVKPQYSDDIINLVSELPPIQIGQKLDVKVNALLLSNELVARNDGGGERVELGKAIEGKYTMICCFHAPIFGTEENSILVQCLVNTCSELYADQGTSFEMVVVVKMKKLADFKPVFDRFLSGFPSLCLVIPFEDPKRRDYICNYLKLNDDDVQCLLLDDNSNVLLHGYPSFVWSYGAEAFPFSEQKMETLKAEQWALDGSSITSDDLLSLLRCNPSDVLRKTNAEGGGCCDSVMMTISDLIKNDVVGVYLCAGGYLIHDLKEVYELCKIQHKNFEVLLVYDPFKTWP